ncbi:hypothetical protein D3C71_2011590 [compost metagenome]
MGRPQTRPKDPHLKLKRLEAENELLKKLLQDVKGGMDAIPNNRKFAVIYKLFSKGNSLYSCVDWLKCPEVFYKWMKRQPFISPKQQEDKAIKRRIEACY